MLPSAVCMIVPYTMAASVMKCFDVESGHTGKALLNIILQIYFIVCFSCMRQVTV